MPDAQGASAGAVWTPHQPHAFWISITSSADGSKLAASGNLGVWTSTDSGVTWTRRTDHSNSYGITSSADGSKLAFLQYGGPIFTSTDSGVTWTARESNRDWFSITSSADGTKLAAVVKDGRIYTSTDSGVTWTARESNRGWHSIASSEDGSKLAAVVFGGQIYTSTDSGVTWSARESNRTWLSITSSADGSKLAAVSGSYGGVGYIYTSTDSGVTWTPRDSARSWICITSSVDGSKLVAVVDGGQIYTSTDSGVTWTARDSNRNWRSIASSADGSKLAAAVIGGLIYTSDTVLRVTPSTADLAINATTLTITGTNFDADIPGNNTVVFTPSGTGTVTAATASSLTVTGITGLTLGALSAVVTTNGENSGSPVQVATIFPPLAPGGEVQLDASALALMDGATVTSWGGQTASDTPTYQANRSPNGLPAVVFNSTDRMGDNVSVPTRSAQDWIYVAVIKPVKTGAYHNLSEDDPGGRPMLWIDNSNRYEFNLGGATRPAIGTGPGGWDIVIADSRLNKLYVNSGTISVDGGGAVAYGTAKNFDFFHRDNTATFQGEVAEVRVYNDRAAFGGDISLLYNELHAKWFAGAAAPTVTSVSPDSGTALGGTSVTITGANFNATTGVTFGGTPATSVNVVNSTTITAVTPGSIAGQVSVLVTTTGGTNAANTLFNYTVVPNTAPSFTLPAGTGGPPGFDWTAREGNRRWYSVTSSADGSKLAAVAWQGRIYTSTDSGVTWTARESNRLWYSITSSADGSKLAAVEENGGLIYTSTDSGVTWTPRGVNRRWYSITSSADGTKLAAVVNGSWIYTSADSGVTWTAQNSGLQSWVSITSSADGSKLAAVPYGGPIYTSTDSGATWTEQSAAGSRNWQAITSSADGSKLAAVVSGGQIYTSTDSGVTWTARDSNRAWQAIASSADGSKLTAGVFGGQIYTSTDSGVTWTARDSNRSWQAIASSADGSKLVAGVAGTGGQIYTSVDTTVPYNLNVGAGSGPQTTPAFATAISSGPVADTGQTVNFTLSNDNNSLFNSQPAIASNGTLTFTPGTTPGVATVTVTAVDNGGTANGGADTSAVQTFTITVNPSGEEITPVTINAVSSDLAASFDRGAIRAVDSSGLSGALHTNVANANMWLTHGTFQAPNDPLPAEITFDLGGAYDVNWLHVWNYNEAGAANRGAKDVTVSVASSPGGAFTPVGNLVFPIATGLTGYPGSRVNFTATNVRQVRLQITTNHGDTQSFAGLSEIKFFGVPSIPQPTVTNVTPATGSTAGGTSVTITGTNFTGATGVTIGGTAATSVSVVNDTTITAVTPAGAAGTASVLVTTPGGTNAANSLFTYFVLNTAPSFTLPAGVITPVGAAWTARDSNRTWRSITSSADGSKLAAVEENGQIYTSTDSGVTWTARDSNRAWRSITSSADGSKLAAVVHNGPIYTSTDSGVTWTPQASGNHSWNSITSSVDGSKLAAVVHNGQIYTSTDSGVTWTARESNRVWFSITSSADGSKLAAAGFGGIFTSTDSGETWTARDSGRLWTSITTSADGSKLAALVSNGQIYTSTDSAETWTARDSDRFWRSITSSADGSKLAAVVDGGPIYTSTDSGVTWTPQASGNRFWSSITSSADGSKLAAVVLYGQIYTSVASSVPYNLTVATGSGLQTTPTFATAISPGPVADAGQTVSFTVSNDNNSLFTSQPTIASNGTLTFTPGTTPGVATVSVIAVDDGGTANGGADTSAAQTFTITLVTPPPTVTAISPATGSSAGGTSVTITGTNFTGATGVTIGGTAVTSVNVVNDTSITAVTPAGTVGTASVLVTTPSGTNAANTLFNYIYTIESWRLEHFGNAIGTGNRADTADFDSDGKSNLLEFAFGTDPTVSTTGELTMSGTYSAATFGTTGQPMIKLEPSANGVDFRLLFIRRADHAAVGVTYIPEFSAGFNPWTPSATIPTVLATSGVFQLVSVPYPHFLPNGKKARFSQVRVSIAP